MSTKNQHLLLKCDQESNQKLKKSWNNGEDIRREDEERESLSQLKLIWPPKQVVQLMSICGMLIYMNYSILDGTWSDLPKFSTSSKTKS